MYVGRIFTIYFLENLEVFLFFPICKNNFFFINKRRASIAISIHSLEQASKIKHGMIDILSGRLLINSQMICTRFKCRLASSTNSLYPILNLIPKIFSDLLFSFASIFFVCLIQSFFFFTFHNIKCFLVFMFNTIFFLYISLLLYLWRHTVQDSAKILRSFASSCIFFLLFFCYFLLLTVLTFLIFLFTFIFFLSFSLFGYLSFFNFSFASFFSLLSLLPDSFAFVLSFFFFFHLCLFSFLSFHIVFSFRVSFLCFFISFSFLYS